MLKIESETAAAAEKSQESSRALVDLLDRLNTLRNKYTANEISVQQAETAATQAESLANIAEEVKQLKIISLNISMFM